MTRHPSDTELALLASGDCAAVSGFLLNRHVRQCPACAETVAEFAGLREELASDDLPNLNWDRLSAEMTANIHLGLEAGACVRISEPERRWNPKLAVAFASLTILLGAGVLLRSPQPKPAPSQALVVPMLQSTGTGLELRTGGNSLTLMNHHGTAAGPTVSTQGEIRASYVDGGAVTFNAVYLE